MRQLDRIAFITGCCCGPVACALLCAFIGYDRDKSALQQSVVAEAAIDITDRYHSQVSCTPATNCILCRSRHDGMGGISSSCSSATGAPCIGTSTMPKRCGAVAFGTTLIGLGIARVLRCRPVANVSAHCSTRIPDPVAKAEAVLTMELSSCSTWHNTYDASKCSTGIDLSYRKSS